jgi:hypothetical protein
MKGSPRRSSSRESELLNVFQADAADAIITAATIVIPKKRAVVKT